jgi:OHCU decarboxylase
VTLDELNALSNADARNAFSACCGAHRWVTQMVARRPFTSVDNLIDTAKAVWSNMNESDWREAFEHHPRIGERTSKQTQGTKAADWSSGEQSRAATGDSEMKRQLADANAEYEARFGHIYIVCAAGKTADELLDIARSRLDNDASTEIRVAADEQRKITELRLRKLMSEDA